MKSRALTCIFAMTLFGALAIPVRLAAQEQPAKQQQNGEHHRYRFVDIGTFGGPASYINFPRDQNGYPAVNSLGTTVGSSATSIPTSATSNGYSCEGINGTVPLVFRGFEWQNGVVTDLGSLPGTNNCSNALSINTKGEIAGISENGVVDPVLGETEIRAVLWRGGEIEDLGTFGGNYSAASGINDRGQVVGFALNAVPDPFSLFFFAGTQTRAFLWHKGEMRDLGTLGGPDSAAGFLNDRGQVVGVSYTNSTPNPTTGLPILDPFLWENGKMVDLGTLGGTNGGPVALNNRGQVIGVSTLPGDQISDPFLWDDGKLIDLFTSTIGGNPITANALNDAGEIIGGGAFPNRVFDAYLWKNGVATDLGTLNGDCFSEAIAINSRGQVVGISVSCDGNPHHAFLWENGSMVDLNTLIPPGSGLQLVLTMAINHRGEIAGVGVPPGVPPPEFNTLGHAFVLVPCGGDHADTDGCQDAAED